MTTSLPLSKQLYKAGLRIETEKKWSKWYYGVLTFGKPAELFEGEYRVIDTPVYLDETEYPAYSTDELLAVMPDNLEINKYLKDKYDVWLEDICCDGQNLNEALGKMALWLLQNGYHYDKEKKWLSK